MTRDDAIKHLNGVECSQCAAIVTLLMQNAERQKILAEVADRLREEYLTDKTGTPEDEAYDAAVGHCIGAVIAMIGDDYGESEIQSQPQEGKS